MTYTVSSGTLNPTQLQLLQNNNLLLHTVAKFSVMGPVTPVWGSRLSAGYVIVLVMCESITVKASKQKW